ncbi:chemotaxis protein CheB [Marinobacter fonticola]|uniref:chemotaxis protein CheB n=1 Tax=Marinobacter fonticola TaxID=2603215 RepID=UPI0011E78BB3|nr:chemotaxis protein CheB [Marinobacter fonticola]
MGDHKIIVIGASLGGVETLPKLLAQLPADLEASVFVVQHMAPEGPGMLPAIIGKASALPVIVPEHNEPIEKGRVYLAPRDRHMLVQQDRIGVVHGPKENRSRPAIDPLLRSAATYFGPRVIGVILTGALDDGSSGLRAIKRCNGKTVVQEPDDAVCNEMPLNALMVAEPVDYQVAVAEMGRILTRLVDEPVGQYVPIPKDIELEVKMAEKAATIEDEQKTGTLVPIACPDCGGALWQHDEGKLQRFRCHVGHSFTALSLLAGQNEELERSLWMTLRALEERANLLKRMTKSALDGGHEMVARWYEDQSADVEDSATKIRTVLNRPASG